MGPVSQLGPRFPSCKPNLVYSHSNDLHQKSKAKLGVRVCNQTRHLRAAASIRNSHFTDQGNNTYTILIQN